MARNEEKAQSMLNRYLRQKNEEAGLVKERRPYLATLVDDPDEAQKWRRDVLREISRKVMEIQNAGLGEGRVRELNDEINKLFREKRHWERRIKDLGGPDFSRNAAPISDADGTIVAGTKGYFYFGAARELPAVKELLATQARYEEEKQKTVSSAELYRRIDAAYFGFGDQEDADELRQEAADEVKARAQLIEQYERAHGKRSPSPGGSDSDDGNDTARLHWGLDDADPKEQLERIALEKRKRQALEKLQQSA